MFADLGHFSQLSIKVNELRDFIIIYAFLIELDI